MSAAMQHQKITRPALRYYGGKWRLAKWLISFFPPHCCYVEPYCGAASVLFQKPISPIEVINDKDQTVVNFFKVLRTRAAELIEAIHLTPYSKTEFLLSSETAEDELERARRFFVRCWQGRQASSTSAQKGGWRYERSLKDRSTRLAKEFSDIDRLWAVAERLKHTQIDCDEALTIIGRYDTAETLFYVDPPYLAETRSETWKRIGYSHEMSEQDHKHLAEALNRAEGMAIVSGYRTELYDELYSGWRREECDEVNDGGKRTVECLWISPKCAAAAFQRRLWSDE